MEKIYTQDYKKASEKFQDEMKQINNDFNESANNEWFFRNRTIESKLSVGVACFMIPFILSIFVFMYFYMSFDKPTVARIFIIFNAIYLIISMFIISPLVINYHLKKHRFYNKHKKDSYLEIIKYWTKYKIEQTLYRNKYKIFYNLNEFCNYNIKILNELSPKYNLESKTNNNINNEEIQRKIKEKEEELLEQSKRIELINLRKKYHWQSMVQYIFGGFLIALFLMMFSVIPYIGGTPPANPNATLVRMFSSFIIFPLCTFIYYMIQYKVDMKVFNTYNQELKNPITQDKKTDYYSLFELENGIAEDICKEAVVLYKKLYNF